MSIDQLQYRSLLRFITLLTALPSLTSGSASGSRAASFIAHQRPIGSRQLAKGILGYNAERTRRFVRPFGSSTPLRSSPGSEGPQEEDDDARPRQNWLQSLKKEAAMTAASVLTSDGELSTDPAEPEEGPDNAAIPSTGVSVSDAIVDSLRDKFVTKLEPIDAVPGVARILTESSGGGDGPIRYLVALSPPPPPGEVAAEGNGATPTPAPAPARRECALVDVPPYSDQLVEKMRAFMGQDSALRSILVTSRDSIHYDESPAVYVTRKSDLTKWKAAFPGVDVVVYRLDIPRDCKDVVTQQLDGEGPWALDEGEDGANSTFVETGRPLTYVEWDEDTAKRVLDGGDIPDEEDNVPDDEELYTPQAIRDREEGKRILAVYTPGRTFGSMSYVFPEMGVCCSGYAVPIEDHRAEENLGMGAGPNMDFRGYITTNTAGIERQIEAARRLVNIYSDRFSVILPARGGTVVFGSDARERRRILNGVLDQYEKIGQIYEQLGITSSS